MSAGKFATFTAAVAGAAGLATFGSNENTASNPNEPIAHSYHLSEAELPQYDVVEINPLSLRTEADTALTVTVQFGDRLETIAETLIRDGYQFRAQLQTQGRTYQEVVTAVVQEICSANNIADPNVLFSNQVLAIPYLTAPTREDEALAKNTHEEVARTFYSYEVKSGDTLTSISRLFKGQGSTASPESIATTSGILVNSIIHPGQILRIPMQATENNEETSATPQVSQSLRLTKNALGISGSRLNSFALRDSFIDMVKTHEGLRLSAYTCVGGICTIGYGHTSNVTPGTRISRADAERLLLVDLTRAERLVAEHVSVPLSQPQYEAFVDMAFNLGPQLFRQKSKHTGQWGDTNTKRILNSLDVPALLENTDQQVALRQYDNWCRSVTNIMDDWVNAGGQRQQGLVNRRAADIALFNQDYSVWKMSMEQRDNRE